VGDRGRVITDCFDLLDLANNHSKQQATMEATFTDKHTTICSPQNILNYGYGRHCRLVQCMPISTEARTKE